MRIYLNLVFAFLFALITVSCNEDDAQEDCVSGEVAFINEVEAPETAIVNEVVAIEVTFSMRNTCGSFNEFRESSTEEGKIIEVLVDYFGCTCGQAIIQETRTYEFTPQSAGMYELNFTPAQEEVITVVIEVTE